MDILLLRFDAPLMSFGGVMIDQHGPIERFPGLSLLTGLFANALGYRHENTEQLEKLQDRIEYAARWDVEPERIVDYHTVDLGQPKMREPGWTTRGEPEHRAGGPGAKFGTHQRYRHYWVNGVMSVAVTLIGNEEPDLTALETALRCPTRPLFLGRKTCLPAGPLLVGRLDSKDVLAALQQAGRASLKDRGISGEAMEACWPFRLGPLPGARLESVYDRRDWGNQLHKGSRARFIGWIREVIE